MRNDQPQRGNFQGSRSTKSMRGFVGGRNKPGVTAENLTPKHALTMTAGTARKMLIDMGLTDKDDQDQVLEAVVDKDTSGASHAYDRNQVATAARMKLSSVPTEDDEPGGGEDPDGDGDEE